MKTLKLLTFLTFTSLLLLTSCSQKNDELKNEKVTTSSNYNLATHYGSNCRLCHAKNQPKITINRFTHSIIGTKNCGDCHNSPGKTWSDGKFNHSIKVACLTCHEADMPAGLVARFRHANIGNRDCGECHLNPGVEWKGGDYDHQNNQGSCQSCHEKNRPQTIVNNFLHSFIKQDCILCHAKPGVTWSGATYTHVPAPTSCSICHESKRPQSPIRAFTHPASRDCLDCHLKPGISWTQGAYNHANTTQCKECHLMQKPLGVVNNFSHSKIGSSDCSTCHHKAGETWSDGFYGHTPAPDTCALCHQGNQPQTGKMVHSVATIGTQDCKTCHLFTGVTWKNAIFNHASVTQCQECHVSQKPALIVKNFDHAKIGNGDCSFCHHKPGVAWNDGYYNHTPAPETCIECHKDKQPLTGKMVHNASTLGSLQDCSNCHNNPGVNWTGAKYPHPKTITNCSQCHEPQRPQLIVSSGFEHSGSCASCHGDFHQSYDCSSCHYQPGVSWKLGNTIVGQGDQCSSCHSVRAPFPLPPTSGPTEPVKINTAPFTPVSLVCPTSPLAGSSGHICTLTPASPADPEGDAVTYFNAGSTCIGTSVNADTGNVTFTASSAGVTCIVKVKAFDKFLYSDAISSATITAAAPMPANVLPYYSNWTKDNDGWAVSGVADRISSGGQNSLGQMAFGFVGGLAKVSKTVNFPTPSKIRFYVQSGGYGGNFGLKIAGKEVFHYPKPGQWKEFGPFDVPAGPTLIEFVSDLDDEYEDTILLSNVNFLAQ